MTQASGCTCKPSSGLSGCGLREMALRHGSVPSAHAPDQLHSLFRSPCSNPHYKPEVAAQTTLLNFCVTASAPGGDGGMRQCCIARARGSNGVAPLQCWHQPA